MSETLDTTRPYEDQRRLLGDVSLRDRRISMLRSRGLIEGDEAFMQQQDDVLKNLNGHSGTHLGDYLLETNYRPIKPPSPPN